MSSDGYLRKLQLEIVDSLRVFSEYCDSHGLTWFLISGSALGAMRHDGFIPWDDDMDVGMLREDYERFLECAERDYPSDYVVDSPSSNEKMAAMFCKISRRGTRFVTNETVEAGYQQGIFIDVIPLDHLAPAGRRRSRQLRNARLWQTVSYLYHARSVNVPHAGPLGLAERIGCVGAHYIFRLALAPRVILSRFSRSIVAKEDSSEGQWCFLTSLHDLFFPEEVLVPPTTHSFEGLTLPVPAQPERYLELMYGDWKTLPPEEKRHTHAPLLIEFSDGSVWKGAS